MILSGYDSPTCTCIQTLLVKPGVGVGRPISVEYTFNFVWPMCLNPEEIM